MFKLTLRGLVAHKLRFLLTGIAVVLGVAFVSGTLVFTDTVKKTFDSLFASVYDGTDAYVRSASVVKGQFGPDRARPDPRDARPARCRAVAGCGRGRGPGPDPARAVPRPQGQGHRRPGPGRADARLQLEHGAAGSTRSRSSPYQRRAVASADRGRRGRDGPRHREGRALPRSATPSRSASTTPRSPRTDFRIVGVAKFGDADRPAGATVALFTLAEAQRVNGTPGQLDGISVAAKPGRRPGASWSRRSRPPSTSAGIQVITGDEADQGAAEPDRAGPRVLHDVPADLRDHRPVRRVVHHRQHVLDRHRAADTRARAAARARRVGATGADARCSVRRCSSGCSRRSSASGWASGWRSGCAR